MQSTRELKAAERSAADSIATLGKQLLMSRNRSYSEGAAKNATDGVIAEMSWVRKGVAGTQANRPESLRSVWHRQRMVISAGEAACGQFSSLKETSQRYYCRMSP